MRILIKYGFGYVVDALPFRLRPRRKKEHLQLNMGERIRLILEDLGSIYIKFAQVLSTRPDIVPEEIILELEKLQDRVPPVPFDEIKVQLIQSFGKNYATLFHSIDEIPIASGSIAQVHRGVLLSGEEVAIKIRRPNLRKKIAQDIFILKDLAGLMEHYLPQLRQYHPMEMVEEFDRLLTLEMDLEREGTHTDHFRKLFEDIPTVVFPEVYWDFTKERVLTLEFIHGTKLSDIIHFRTTGFDPLEVADTGGYAINLMVFRFGYFHADPHPGNILILPDKRVCFLDCGLVGIMDDESSAFLAELMFGVVNRDVQSIIHAFFEYEMLPERVNLRSLKEKINQLFEEYYDSRLEDMKVSQFTQDLFQIIRTYNISIPSSLLLLIKILVVYEGLARQLNPAYNPVRSLRPHIEEMMLRQYQPKQVIHDIQDFAKQGLHMLRNIPTDIYPLFRKMNRGDLYVNVNQERLKDLNKTIHRSTRRISMTLIAVASIIAGAWLAVSNIGVSIVGIPLISWISFLIGSFLVLFVILMDIREPRD